MLSLLPPPPAPQTVNTAVALATLPRFVDKSHALVSHYGPDARFYFVMGWDTVIRFFDAKYYPGVDVVKVMDEFFQTGRLVIANRIVSDGGEVEEQEQRLKVFLGDQISSKDDKAALLASRYRDRIVVLPDWLSDATHIAKLSSTVARRALKEYWEARKPGCDDAAEKVIETKLKHIIPVPVLDYILQEGLYSD
ncbi:hypothetical protein HK104_001516 [Borealophlyctis nickersoniae]|nr:hypothetical protein HK104_001516 [Borealophlyctis nickersoniae]